MKGFRFRLEPVLALRKHREETLQCRLAEAQRTLDSEVARLKSIDGAIESQTRLMARQQEPGPLDMDSLWRQSSYLVAMERQRQDQAARVEEQTTRVAAERDAVLGASRDRKALEKVRENLLVAFERETARKEQKGVEEIATVRHLLRMQAQPEGL